MWICQPHNHSDLTILEFLTKRTPLEVPIQTINHHPIGLWEAESAINVEEIRGYHHLSYPHLPWIVGLKVIGVLWWQSHWCCHCQTGWKAPSIPDVVDDVGREPTWRSIFESIKMRMQRMLSPTTVGGGIWWYTIVQDVEIAPSSCMTYGLCKVIPKN